MPVQACQNLHKCNSHLTRDRRPKNYTPKNGHFSLLTTLCMQNMSVLASDSAVGHFSRYTPPQPHDHKDGFLTKVGREALLWTPLRVDHQTPHFPPQAADSAPLSDI